MVSAVKIDIYKGPIKFQLNEYGLKYCNNQIELLQGHIQSIVLLRSAGIINDEITYNRCLVDVLKKVSILLMEYNNQSFDGIIRSMTDDFYLVTKEFNKNAIAWKQWFKL